MGTSDSDALYGINGFDASALMAAVVQGLSP